MTISFVNPLAVAGENFSWVENNPAGNILLSATATSNDGTVSYSLTGDDAALFRIDSTGKVTTNISFNYEQPLDSNGDNQYRFVVRAMAGGLVVSELVTLDISNQLESPSLISPESVQVSENSSGYFYQMLMNNISQNDRAVSYQLLGVDALAFSINANNGQISFVSSPDYENGNGSGGANHNNYNIIGQVTLAGPDGNYNISQGISVAVTNVVEPAHFITSDHADAYRGDSKQIITTLRAVDSDGGRHFTYALVWDDTQSLQINSNTGVLQFSDSNWFSNSSRNHYAVWVQAVSDQGEVLYQYVNVDVKSGHNPAGSGGPSGPSTPSGPTGPSGPSGPSDPGGGVNPSLVWVGPVANGGTVLENNTDTGVVVLAAFSDGTPVNYTLSDNRFTINANGHLQLVAPLDYDDPNQDKVFDITIIASDTNSSIVISTLTTISLVNVDDNAPVITNGLGQVVNDTTTGYVYFSDEVIDVVTTMTAVDLDGGAISFSLDDTSIFSIEQNGVLHYHGPQHQHQNGYHTNYTVQITATSLDQPSAGGISSSRVAITHDYLMMIDRPNDFLPDFVSGDRNLTLSENNSAGLLLGRYAASDADHATISYSLNDSNHFSIDQQGNLYFLSTADYEMQSSYSLVLTASSSGDSATRAVVLQILNQNDNAPMFVSGARIVSVLEHNAVGVGVGNYQATDLDGGTISYSVDDNNNFSIDQDGQLYLNSVTDHAGQSYYSLVITAHAVNQPLGGSATNIVSTLVVVEVLAQPAPPPTPLQFVGGMTNLSLLENNEIGVNIGLFSAIAGDGIITYGVSDPLFSIDQNGRLYFQGIADYESHSRYKIFVNASNGNAVVSEMVNVFIGNENDNSIDMVVGNLNVVVNENNTSGLMLTQLVFADADGGDISYSLSDNIHFSIDDTGAIYAKGSFDYEQQSNYSLVVTATSLNQPVDGTASNIASRLVQVMVINGDDNAPLFTNTAGHVAVSENNAVGLSLGYYPAIDIDGGAMVYSVDDNNNFSIDSEGRLYFTTSAHYQQQAHYSVVITAHATNQPHTGSASDYVSQLLVVDIDQVTPPAPPTATVALHYDIDKIDATLIENNASGVWLANVAVSGSRAIATHYNGDNAAFSIDDAGNVYFLSMADFETQNTYSLVVIASNDAGEYTSELLRLKIANQNDNAPQFISGNGAVSLLENNTRGVAVGTYLAADADGGSISYSLDNNNFSLGSNGVLYFLSRANYETTAFYSVVITAHSYNQPLAGDASNSATQLVVLAIGNQNDNAPNFVNFNLLYSLPEHTAPNQQIALYSAVDADGGSISYHIIGDHFSIDQSGRVYFTDVADHNSQSLYYYTVVATSLGQPTVGAAMTESWTLGILTITNNPDYFNIYSTLDNAIWENAPRTTLGAVTGDDSMGGVLTYSVSDDHFQIDSNGMLATVRAFDHEGQKQVSALVTITSSLRPTPISQLLVFDIINSNDNPITPVNWQGNYSLMENNRSGILLGDYQAVDADGGTVAYSVNDGHFSIDQTGKLYFASTLSYESGQQYSVVVTAESLQQSDIGGASNVVSQLVVLDVVAADNSHQPVFSFGDYPHVELFEDNIMGSVLSVYDAASPAGDTIFYSVDDNVNFLIISEAVLYLRPTVDYEKVKHYTTVITAISDSTSLNNRASFLFTLDIRNVDDNAPIFNLAPTQMSIYENNMTGLSLATYQATDADGGTISYSVNDARFSIDNSGVLYFNGSADYETQAHYSLVITAHSLGQPTDPSDYWINLVVPTATTVVSITAVIDVINTNDSPIGWVASPTTTLSLNEYNQAGVAIGNYRASDPDGGGISYMISNDGDFSIDANGRLYFTQVGNYNNQANYTVTILARSNGQPALGNALGAVSTAVVLHINDVWSNEYAPNFSSGSAPSFIGINSTPGVALLGDYAATDLDGARNNQGQAIANSFSYSISNNYGGHFSIDATGKLYAMALNDAGIHSYSLVVTAMSENQSSVGTASNYVSQLVNITVLDSWANYNAPTFVSLAPTISVHETIANGSVVYSLVATDSDGARDSSGQGVPVSFNYSLSDNSHFSIDAAGHIYAYNLDYNSQAVYSLVITAQSLNQSTIGQASNYVSVLETIQVINDNNHAPVFYDAGQPLTSPRHVTLYRDQMLNGANLVSITAIDLDGGTIAYVLNDNLNFGYSNGVVFFNPPANLPINNHYNLYMNAFSSNQPATGNASNFTGLVNVLSLDILDPIYFAQPSVSFSMLENQTLNNDVGFVVAADPNVGHAATISYSMSGSDAIYFSIDSASGHLVLKGPADDKVRISYSLVVNAQVVDNVEQASQLVILHVIPEIHNLANDSSDHFFMTGGDNYNNFTIYYNPASSPWTGGDAGGRPIAAFNFNPTTDHLIFDSFANYGGVNSSADGGGGIANQASFESYLADHHFTITLTGGDINVPLGNGITLLVSQGNNSDGTHKAFVDPTTHLDHGNLTFADFIQMVGGVDHLSFVG